MAVAEDEGTPGEGVVDVLVAVGIDEPGTTAIAEIKRHRELGAKRAADSTG
jgi:hypothetical protein